MGIATNNLKKGDVVRLTHTNWRATIKDNMKGNIRMMDVEGLHREIGSVYVWDIRDVIAMGGVELDPPTRIELTDRQNKARTAIESLFA